jgi:type VI secretion system secreted protein Hcp
LRRRHAEEHAGAVAESWFLKLDGVDGESRAVAHKGEIDVESWSWGVSNTEPPGGGAGGAGRAQFREFQFVSRISKASPGLLRACATGSHHKHAMLTGERMTGEGKAGSFLKYKLSDVVVTHVDQSAEMPTDQFGLAYSKIEVSYFPQDDKSGKFGKAVTASFDLKSQKF